MILRKRIPFWCGFFALALVVLPAEATMKDSLTAVFYNNFEFSAAGGWNWFETNDTDLTISSVETDTLQISNTSNQTAWKVGIGYYLLENQLSQRPYLNHLLLELNVYYVAATINGTVWQFELPQFYNYDFDAPVSSTRFMLDFKPSLLTWNKLSPYAILGIGAAWNKTEYDETALANIDVRSALSLNNYTTTQLAWDLGLGLRYVITNHISATAEYVYAFLGHGTPSDGPKYDVRLADAPSFSFETQSLLLGLSVAL